MSRKKKQTGNEALEGLPVGKHIKEKIEHLLRDIGRGVYEKDEELLLAMLAALSGENLLLLGPPGVAKSLIARQMKYAFRDARSFEYLMSRFSTPDEIFGPVSISKLKDSDCYERATEGYLPTADVVFLDEIWKAGPAIQNTLLTAINEKVFRNGNHEVKLPLKLLVAASNELPAEDEGLEALWDRFIIRVVSSPIKHEETFYRMLLDVHSEDAVETDFAFSEAEFETCREAVRQIDVPAEILCAISAIRQALQHVSIGDAGVEHSIYVSDRRWKKIVNLLKTAALMNGHRSVALSDLYVACHCLWNAPEEREAVRQIVLKAMSAPVNRKLDEIERTLHGDLRMASVQKALREIEQSGQDAACRIYDNFYYLVLNHDTGHTYILLADYHNLISAKAVHNGAAPAQGILYRDPANPKRTIVRTIAAGVDTSLDVLRHVNLCRGDSTLFVDGVRFFIDQLPPGQVNVYRAGEGRALCRMDYEAEIEAAAAAIAQVEEQAHANIFVAKGSMGDIEHYLADERKRIALLRADIAKLLYE